MARRPNMARLVWQGQDLVEGRAVPRRKGRHTTRIATPKEIAALVRKLTKVSHTQRHSDSVMVTRVRRERPELFVTGRGRLA